MCAFLSLNHLQAVSANTSLQGRTTNLDPSDPPPQARTTNLDPSDPGIYYRQQRHLDFFFNRNNGISKILVKSLLTQQQQGGASAAAVTAMTSVIFGWEFIAGK